MSRNGNFPKVANVTCRSRVGCRKLATAVLQCYYDDKELKVKALERAKSKLKKMVNAPVIIYEKQVALVDRLEHELKVYVRFEHTPLYHLYFNFLQEVIDKNQIEEGEIKYYEKQLY